MAYFLKRLLLFIPTIWVIAVFVFFLTKLSPGNPVLNQLSELELNGQQLKAEEQALVQNYGFDQALFYFSIHRKTISDTLHRIWQEPLKSNLKQIAFESRNWPAVNAFYAVVKANLRTETNTYNSLLNCSSISELKTVSQEIDLKNTEVLKAIETIDSDRNSAVNNYLPVFSWHGFNNQFHHWISNFISGDFGLSYVDRQPIGDKITNAIQWTLVLSLLSIFLAFAIAVPAAIHAAKNIDGRFDRMMGKLFMGLYSLPTFWVGTLLIIYFANQEYLPWFPAYGVGEVPEDSSFTELISIRISHLFLPLVCWTYGSFAYIFRQLRNSLHLESQKDYFLAAKAKGLSHSKLYTKHALRNAFLPLITLIGNIFPAVISGSFIIEYLFSIPGMGKLSLEAFFSRDYPLIFAILMMAAFLSLLGNLIADLLYQKADPRLNLSEKKG